jgi:hypothetical protein
MGGVANTVKQAVSNPAKTFGQGLGAISTGGLSLLAPHSAIGRVGGDVGSALTFGASGAPVNPFSGAPLYGDKNPNPYIGGPFSLDPNQISGDRAAITGEGDQQYAESLGSIDDVNRAELNQAKQSFADLLPNIAENANAAHLYDSTGYGQEVARQQSNIASQLASDQANRKYAALSGRQGFQSAALQRGLSLEDFVNQANVAKTIGAQMAPPPPSGKQNFGTVAQGVGALAPLAKIGKA